MKTKYIVLTILIAFVVLWIALISRTLPTREGVANVTIGETIETDIQTPHPYPNGEDGRTLVWSETIEYPGAAFMRLHFSKIDILGERFEPPTIYEEVDYGECDLNAPPGWTREWNGENTITQKQIVEESDEDGIRVGGISIIKCGIAEEKKEFTAQELFDNNLDWADGDFLVVRNAGGVAIDIIHGKSYGRYEAGSGIIYKKEDVWSKSYWNTDKITLELYADETQNSFGLYIDKYIRGFTEEELEEAN